MRDVIQCKRCGTWTDSEVFYDPKDLRDRARPRKFCLPILHDGGGGKTACGCTDKMMAEALVKTNFISWPNACEDEDIDDHPPTASEVRLGIRNKPNFK